MEKRFNAWERLPLFRKAEELRTLVEHLVKAIEKTDIEVKENIQIEMITDNLQFMRKNAMLIPAKIAGASSDEMPYDIRMENATLIRKAAKELSTDLVFLEMNGYKDVEYLNLLRNEINEFRILFAEWVKTFDIWNYHIDRWGLFNPPGINYDDHDPDDDL